MKYLVCRFDAVHKEYPGQMIQSSRFPIEVEFNRHTAEELRAGYSTPEAIARRAFNSINPGYVGPYQYLVVPLYPAVVVSFKRPTPKLEVSVQDYL